jgi:hypothetical protein
MVTHIGSFTRFLSRVLYSASVFGQITQNLYSSFCLYIWGQLLLKLIIIKQFILFYAAHTNH